MSDALNHSTTYAYDDQNDTLTVTYADPDGAAGPLASPTAVLAFDARGLLISETDPNGNVTQFAYDGLGRQIEQTDPDPDGAGPLAAPETEFTYDGSGNLRYVVDALGNSTEYQYDLANRLIKRIDPDPDGAGPLAAPETSYRYDAAGYQAAVTDPLSRETSYEYDALGRQTKVIQPDPDGAGGVDAPETTYTYDEVGNLLTETDAEGNVTTYAYDHRDRLTTITEADPDGTGSQTSPVTVFEYDAADQLISITDPLSRKTSYEYDALGRQTKVIQPDPDGAGPLVSPETTYTYDAVGNVLSMTDALGHATQYEYDNLYRQIGETDANGDVTQFEYDLVGNLTKLTDAAGNETSWLHDGLDRVVEETNSLDLSRYFEYDLVGNVVEMTDRNGRVIGYAYDDLYRLTDEDWYAEQAAADAGASLRTIHWDYDVASQLTGSTDPDHDYTYQYDGLGRTLEKSHQVTGLADVVAFDITYDAIGNRDELTATIGTALDFVNKYEFDNLYRLDVLTQDAATGSPHAVAGKRADFDYDLAGQRERLERFAGALASDPLVVATDYGYDQVGRLLEIDHTDGAATRIVRHGYTWDAGNRITQYDNSVDGVVDYTYDPTNQLTLVDYLGDWLADEDYRYDANGNRVDTDGDATNGDNQTFDPAAHNNYLRSDGTYDFEYDGEGNIIRQTAADGSHTEFTWDHRNRMVEVTSVDDQAAEVWSVEYSYDAADDLVRRRVFLAGSTTADESQVFIYDEGQAVLEFEGTGNADLAVADFAHRYLWNPAAVDEILADETVNSLTDATLNDVLWAATDHQGTPRDWLDSSGAVVDHAIYSSFGQRENAQTVENVANWTGRFEDPITKLQWNRKRWYNAEIGRWMSQDWIKDGYNWQAYVGNSPVINVDPSGLQEWRLVDAEGNSGPLGHQFSYKAPNATIFYDTAPMTHYHDTTLIVVTVPDDRNKSISIYETIPHNLDRGFGQMKHTYNKLEMAFPRNTNEKAVLGKIHEDLKTFAHFNRGHNSIANVRLKDGRAYFDTLGRFGDASDLLNREEVPVKLDYDDSNRKITGTTLGAHMLSGIRQWRAINGRTADGRLTITIETESYDKCHGLLNWIGGELAGDSNQLLVWEQYLRNIYDHYASEYGAELLPGSLLKGKANPAPTGRQR